MKTSWLPAEPPILNFTWRKVFPTCIKIWWKKLATTISRWVLLVPGHSRPLLLSRRRTNPCQWAVWLCWFWRAETSRSAAHVSPSSRRQRQTGGPPSHTFPRASQRSNSPSGLKWFGALVVKRLLCMHSEKINIPRCRNTIKALKDFLRAAGLTLRSNNNNTHPSGRDIHGPNNVTAQLILQSLL